MLTASFGWTGRLAAADAAVEPLVGDPGDHLVGVHVGRGAAAGLEDVEDELVVVLTVGDGLRGLDDRLAELGGQQPQVHVDLRRRLLDQPHRAEERARKSERADLEVLDRAARLGPVIGLDGHFHLPHRIPFLASLGQGKSLPSESIDRRPTNDPPLPFLGSGPRIP